MFTLYLLALFIAYTIAILLHVIKIVKLGRKQGTREELAENGFMIRRLNKRLFTYAIVFIVVIFVSYFLMFSLFGSA
ncbi:hypothetical protein [Taibaiella soli]|uniref:Uncharacterized protein n=1 Tax=Taibaiella soli TaxID=1649169 RepID=A0A2W2BME0_9BACT|nr:hypothetical protein [Taibaiella soli]PZF74616.1 hypothetical protein DN068_03295 [Taibaiella soli]